MSDRIQFSVPEPVLVDRLRELDGIFLQHRTGIRRLNPEQESFLDAEANWLWMARESHPFFPSLKRDFSIERDRRRRWHFQRVANKYLGVSTLSGSPALSRLRRHGFVYFVRAGDFIKIGFAVDVQRRIASLQTGSPMPLTLLATTPGTLDSERAYHKRFDELWERGEWFRAVDPLVSFVDGMRTMQAEAPRG